MISHGVEISIARDVGEKVPGPPIVTIFLFFFFSFFLFFFFSFFLFFFFSFLIFFFFSFLFSLNHMFIVSMVQEMTCIFNDMAKTKQKIKLIINKRNKHNQFPQSDQ